MDLIGPFSHSWTTTDSPLTEACGSTRMEFISPVSFSAISVASGWPQTHVTYFTVTSTTRQDPDDPGLLAKVGG